MQPDNSSLHSIGEGSVHGQSNESSPYSSTLSKHWAALLKAWIACGLVMAMLIGWQLYRRAEVSRVQWFHQECTNRAQVSFAKMLLAGTDGNETASSIPGPGRSTA
jgi:hypothetical protein